MPRFTTWPDVSPDDSLWPRIVAARGRQLTKRRRYKFISGSAAVAAVAMIAIWWSSIQVGPLSESDPLASVREQSQELEREWQALADTSSLQASGFARLQGVDHALQRAYDRNADSDELAALWAQRTLILQRLVSRARDPEGVATI
ncbi:MAG: hypothetical protein ABI451_01530 [Dokdonella sp.]